MDITSAILALVTNAPVAINEIKALYAAVKSDLSATDQSQIDAALAQAIANDVAATKAADIALGAASKR